MLFTPVTDGTYMVHHHYVHISVVAYKSTNHQSHAPIMIDRERLDKAMQADRVALPKGLNKAQIHDFLLTRAKQLTS